jgi:Co/Zn/Cd efflux system component
VHRNKAAKLVEAIEKESTDRVADLHMWNIGHGIYAAEIALVSDKPNTPSYYKSLIPSELNIVHTTVEIHRCTNH